MKRILLGAALVAMTAYPAAALTTNAATELQGIQILGFPLTTTSSPICTFRAAHAGKLMFIGSGVDDRRGGSTTTYELRVNGALKQTWAFGNMNLGIVSMVAAGQTIQVRGKYTGGTGATVTAANLSVIISQK